MKNSLRNSFKIFWQLLLPVFIAFSMYKIVIDTSFITLLQIILFFLFFLDCYISCYRADPFWVGSLFLYSFFVFLLGRIFLDFLGIKSMYYSDHYAWYTISNNTTEVILISYICFLLVYLVVVSTSKIGDMKNGQNQFKYQGSSLLESLSEKVLLFCIPLGIANSIRIILTTDYISTFIYGNVEFSPLSIFSYIATATIPVYFASLPRRKHRTYIFALIILMGAASALIGSRARFVSIIVFFLWYFKMSGMNIKLGKICAVSLLVILFTDFVYKSREVFLEYSALDTGWDITNTFVVKMLYSLGGTHMVFANYIDYRNEIFSDTHFYFINGFINPIQRLLLNRSEFLAGRNADLANISFSLDYKLMEAINPIAFAEGRGIGGNVVTEMWAFAGYIGVILGAIIFIKLFIYFSKKSCISPGFFIINYYWLLNTVWAPRGSFLPDSLFLALSFIIYFLLNVIIHRGKVTL